MAAEGTDANGCNRCSTQQGCNIPPSADGDAKIDCGTKRNDLVKWVCTTQFVQVTTYSKRAACHVPPGDF